MNNYCLLQSTNTGPQTQSVGRAISANLLQVEAFKLEINKSVAPLQVSSRRHNQGATLCNLHCDINFIIIKSLSPLSRNV
jgi:hypothetical protein